MKRKINLSYRVPLSLFVGLLALSFASLPATAQESAELSYGMGNNVDTLDPNVTTFSTVGVIMGHVFDTLVRQYPLGEFHPGLATEWSVNDDATEYSFTLRDDVTFHDGTPLNADAIKFTFDRIVDPDTQSQMAFSFIGPYMETEVVSDTEIIVKFSEPFAPFLDSASQPQLGIVSPTAVAELGEEFGLSTVVGSGPYMLESYTPESEVVLARNDDYNWGSEDIFGMGGPGNFERITFKLILEPGTRLAALESGEVDFIDDVPELDVARLQDDPNVEIVQVEQPGHGWSLMMNAENSPTDELAVRQAIAMASDKQGMIDVVFNGFGTPACSPLTKVMFAYSDIGCQQLPYDPDAAGATLDEAGWVMNDETGVRERDGEALALEHWFRAESSVGSAMATFMQADLSQYGIQVNLNGASASGYFDAVRAGEHNTQNWWDTQTDPGAVMRTLYHSSNADGGTNRNRYRNDTMDTLIAEAAGASDSEQRATLYEEIQQLVADDVVMVFYNDPFLLFGHSPALTGVIYMGGGFSPNLYGASFSE
jgi:peptide/nickel transport system substrate-binding protein